jgi:ribonuclease HI
MEICVDASCRKNPGEFEYRGVEKGTKKELFSYKFEYGTNNIGEFLAIIHAISYLKRNNIVEATIYSDSKTALAWVRDKKCKTSIIPHENNEINEKLKKLLNRAEVVLNENVSYSIVKWDTEKLGEIEADYGRKKSKK